MQKMETNKVVLQMKRQLESLNQNMLDSDRRTDAIYKSFSMAMDGSTETMNKLQLFETATEEYKDHIANMKENRILLQGILDKQTEYLRVHGHDCKNEFDFVEEKGESKPPWQHESQKLKEENYHLRVLYKETKDAYNKLVENTRISQPMQSEDDLRMIDTLKKNVKMLPGEKEALFDENKKLQFKIDEFVHENSLHDLQEGKAVLQAIWDIIYCMDLRAGEDEEMVGIQSDGNLIPYEEE